MGAAGVAGVVYGVWVRPRLWRWGATDEEVSGPYPRGLSRWAVIAGVGIHGTDSTAGGRPSAQEVHPEWQDLALGDYVKYWSRSGPVDAWEVAALEPNRFLALRGLMDLRGRNLDPKQPRPSSYVEGLWCFMLNELRGRQTRLVVGGYQAIRPRWIERFVTDWLYIPVTWIMQARMLVVLERNIERAARVRPHTMALRENPWWNLGGCRRLHDQGRSVVSSSER